MAVHPRSTVWCAGKVVADALEDREGWLAARRRYVTASDIAKAMSVPWTSGKRQTPGHERYQALLQRKRSGEEVERNQQMWWGYELEPYVIERLALAPGSPLEGWPVRPCGLLIEDPQCRYLAASTDMWLDDGEGPMCGDVKLSKFAWSPSKHKREPKDYVPRDYQLQIQAQMACTGAQRGALVQFVGNSVDNCIVYERDNAVIDRIRMAAEMFMFEVDGGSGHEQ